MKNKKFLLLIVALLIVSTAVASVEAKKSDYESPRQANTAGVAGASGEAMRALSNMDVQLCKTPECKDLKKEIESLNDQIEIFEVGFSKTIIDAKIKDNKELKNTDNEAVFKSLQGDIKKLSSSINNIPKGKVIPCKERVELFDQREQKINKFVELVPAYNSEWSKLSPLLEKRVELNDQLLKEIENKKNINGNQDQPDVEPVESGYLENGDLVAWGIPGIPYIPTPRPKATTTTTTPSSTSTPAQKQEISDEGYKSLRSVEMESEKVTEPEKDQFISELNSRVGSN